MTTYEYEVTGSRYSCQADDKFTAYCTMLVQHHNVPHLIMILAPEDCKKDTWMSLDKTYDIRLDHLFGGPQAFNIYFNGHMPMIIACFKTIQKIERTNEKEVSGVAQEDAVSPRLDSDKGISDPSGTAKGDGGMGVQNKDAV